MELKARAKDPFKVKASCLILGAWEKGFSTPLLSRLDQTMQGAIRRAVRSGEFSGKKGEMLILHPSPEFPAQKILLVGVGPRNQFDLEQLRQAAGRALGALVGQHLSQVVCALPLLAIPQAGLAERIQATAEGSLLATYRFTRYQSRKTLQETLLPKGLTLLVERPKDLEQADQAISTATRICRAVSLARDLVNEPGNVKSPEWLADQARAAAAEGEFNCTVIDRQSLVRDGFGALLGVAQGSEREPCLILLEHLGGPADAAPVALVGKGVVFDAGGISLKPAEKMDEMKMDMAGGAAVIGTLLAAALLKLPINLVGVIPAVENLPSGSAIRPGDILTSLSGKTIEVLNTDAEGRLILADALTYVKRFAPSLVIDLATLTGACVIALGQHASAVLGNDQSLVRQLIKAGESCGERLWQLPLWDEYDQQVKSEVADLKNTGGRPAGTITAAAFLKPFAEGTRWAHIDIAGTAWRDKPAPYATKGGTGVGVRLLLAYLQSLSCPRS
ncbi:MAG: leucyl aminopeptidase [Desulfuromonas sp.]|nr:MAG: leucyl aminopeptidase [Desulfuromonas sp.]